MFASGLYAIMTGSTRLSCHRRVIEVYQPTASGMTHITCLCGSDMIRAFATRNHTIVTAFTGTNRLCMIRGTRRQGRPGLRWYTMTGLAAIGGVNMIQSFTAGGRTVVTTDTSSNHLCVIYVSGYYRYPGCRARRMTGIALIATVDVAGSHPACYHTIMTTDAGTIDLSMIYCCGIYWRPGGRCFFMAGVTYIR